MTTIRRTHARNGDPTDRRPENLEDWEIDVGPRLFTLVRDVDETGVSGTGTVAEGVVFSDGVVALRWLIPAGQAATGYPTSVVFHDRGIESVEKIHGHGGKTRIVYA